jgi:hypothetical protein
MTPSDDRYFELLLSKLDSMHEDMKDLANRQEQFDRRLDDHILDDREVAKEVWFIKRSFQATWALVGMFLAYLGIKNVS